MPVESAADLAVFFNPDEFGTVATYVPVEGVAAEVTVILDTPETLAPVGSLGIAEFAPAARIRLSELPAGAPAEGDVLVIAGVAYAVNGGQADNSGRVMVLDIELRQ